MPLGSQMPSGNLHHQLDRVGFGDAADCDLGDHGLTALGLGVLHHLAAFADRRAYSVSQRTIQSS